MSYPSLAPFVVVVAMVVAAPAQQSRLQETFAKHYADLDSGTRAEDAARALVHLGKAAVPMLRERLQTQNRSGESQPRVHGAMYVLARIGKPAVEAWPELTVIHRAATDDLKRQAFWTMSQLLPWADDEQATTLEKDYQQATWVRGNEDYSVVMTGWWQMQLHREPSPSNLLRMLGDAGARDLALSGLSPQRLTAAANWIAAHPEFAPGDLATIEKLLIERLDEAQQMAVIPWEQSWDSGWAAPMLAEALLAVRPAPLGSATARALLQHWDPDQRLRAAAWFEDGGHALPVLERAAIVGCIWDGEASIAKTAVNALSAWGRNGLVGLPALRWLERHAPDRAFADLCRETAERVIASTRTGDGPAGETATALDAALRGVDAARPELVDPTTVHDVLIGARWTGADELQRLLQFHDECGLKAEPVAPHLLRLAFVAGNETATVALAWLAGHPDATALAAGKDRDPMASYWAIRTYACPQNYGVSIEACAWLRIPRVPTTEALRDQALASSDLRRVTRGLAAAIANSPGVLPACRDSLRELVALPDDWISTVPPERREWPTTLQTDLSTETRLLAAIALCSFGDLEFDATLVAETVRKECGVEVLDLPAWVTAQRENGTLAAFLDGVEASCRERLSVRHGVWPTVR